MLRYDTLLSAGCITLAALIQSRALLIDTGRYNGENLRLNLSPPYLREVLLLLNLTFVKLSVRSSGMMALKLSLTREDDKRMGKVHLELIALANLRFLRSSYNWWSVKRLTGKYHDGFMSHHIVRARNHYANTIYAIYINNIPAWGQSPFDTAFIPFKENRNHRTPGQCMHLLANRYHDGPQKPRERQESLCISHP